MPLFIKYSYVIFICLIDSYHLTIDYMSFRSMVENDSLNRSLLSHQTLRFAADFELDFNPLITEKIV